MKHTVILILALSFNSCTKQDDLDTHRGMWDCHTANQWSKETNEQALAGLWEVRNRKCSAIGTRIHDINFLLEFLPDHRVWKVRGGERFEELKWSLEEKPGSPLYLLNFEPDNQDLSGLVLFCGDRMEINNSFRQGCDRYFSKIN